jgi:hypothetical protein
MVKRCPGGVERPSASSERVVAPRTVTVAANGPLPSAELMCGDRIRKTPLLIARPAGSGAFPRRRWAVTADNASIGEVVLTGWADGTICLHDSLCSVASTQPISLALPREYSLLRDDNVIHRALESSRLYYRIDDALVLRCEQAAPWKYFGRSWPGFRLYRQSDRSAIGSIFQDRALCDDVTIEMPSTVDELLQLFLFWLVVDRAQWRAYFDDAG